MRFGNIKNAVGSLFVHVIDVETIMVITITLDLVVRKSRAGFPKRWKPYKMKIVVGKKLWNCVITHGIVLILPIHLVRSMRLFANIKFAIVEQRYSHIKS